MVSGLNQCSLPGVGVLNRAPTLDEYRLAEFFMQTEADFQMKRGLFWKRLRKVIRMKMQQELGRCP